MNLERLAERLKQEKNLRVEKHGMHLEIAINGIEETSTVDSNGTLCCGWNTEDKVKRTTRRIIKIIRKHTCVVDTEAIEHIEVSTVICWANLQKRIDRMMILKYFPEAKKKKGMAQKNHSLFLLKVERFKFN